MTFIWKEHLKLHKPHGLIFVNKIMAVLLLQVQILAFTETLDRQITRKNFG